MGSRVPVDDSQGCGLLRRLDETDFMLEDSFVSLANVSQMNWLSIASEWTQNGLSLSAVFIYENHCRYSLASKL